MDSKIGIIGIGAWATALAIMLANNQTPVVMWSHEIDTVEEIRKKFENQKYLPNVVIPNSVEITNEKEKLTDCQLIVQAVPTQYIRRILEEINIDLCNKKIVNVAKGIEKTKLKRVSEILSDFGIFEKNYAVLSGPSHAEEVARMGPTAVVVASTNLDFAVEVQKLFTNAHFRVYTSTDVVGCELGGALKNVIAIAAGIIDGLQLGDNSKAALITRGLAEITRLGVAMGAKPSTFSGLSGLGDLIVTCNSKYSRNRYVGQQIALGHALSDILNNMNAVAEGVDTTISAHLLSFRYNVELPIAQKVYQILFENLNPKDAVISLMLRETKPEYWW
ncbi:MAG: NAD(P)H-dependent glycerol-3-phosphate dehydrogenase [Candidatus Kapaibacteriota bacterium]